MSLIRSCSATRRFWLRWSTESKELASIGELTMRAGCAPSRSSRVGFTLVELLVSIAILTVLAAMLVVGLAGVTETARIDRTETQIERLNSLMMPQWESYKTRRVKLDETLPPALQGISKQQKAGQHRYKLQQRLVAMRELMRMELPDRKAEVFAVPTVLQSPPARWLAYQRMAMRLTNTTTLAAAATVWTEDFEASECLYLILSRTYDGDSNALTFLRQDEIVDTDSDGMPEIVDGWGHPILFMRWAPGFSAHPGLDGAWGAQGVDDDADGIVDNTSEAGWFGTDDIPTPSSMHDRRVVRDEFDPLMVDDRWLQIAPSGVNQPLQTPFPLYPLIVSAGSDQQYGLHGSDVVSVGVSDPYFVNPATGFQQGLPRYNEPESAAYLDNIHNQAL